MKQIKCPKCETWSVNAEECNGCGHLFPVFKNSSQPELSDEEKERRGLNKPEMSSKMRAYLDGLYASRNPLKKMLYYLIMSVWAVYVGLVVFMLYIAVLGSG